MKCQNDAVRRAVDRGMNLGVGVAVYWAVNVAVDWDVNRAVNRSVNEAVTGDEAVNWALNDPEHPALQDFLRSCGAEVEV